MKTSQKLLLAALTVTSLGQAPIASAGESVIEVKLADFAYALSANSVPAGRVTFKLKNFGGTPHDFDIAGKNSGMIAKGGSGEFSVNLTPGTYEYHCTVPGHAEAGMKGTITVRAGS